MILKPEALKVVGEFNTTTGRDAVAGPTLLNERFFVGTQQNGPDGGGTILRWKNDAPTLDKEFEGILVNEEATIQIDLNEHFSDIENDAITFSVASSDDQIIGSILAENVITLNALGIGIATITVSAEDEWGGETIAEFDMGVNAIPKLTGALPDVILDKGFGSFEINISDQFTDEDGDELMFDLTFSNIELLNDLVFLNGILTVNESNSGATSVEVFVADGRAGTATVSFDLLIALNVNEGEVFDLYPNPFQDFISIKNENFELLKVIDLEGRTLKNIQLVPGVNQLDLKDLENGTYLIHLIERLNGKTVVRKLIKN